MTSCRIEFGILFLPIAGLTATALTAAAVRQGNSREQDDQHHLLLAVIICP
jgi:hypothetical protein